MTYHYIQLYVEGLPVDYNMIVKGNHFTFEPGYHAHKDLKAPLFSVELKDDRLIFNSIIDESLKDQAEEELLNYIKKWSE